MTKYFIDTTILQASFNISDTQHNIAHKLLDKIIQQQVEPAFYVSDYVIDETISLIIARTRNKGSAYARSIINTIFENLNNSRLYKILHVDETTFASALTYVKQRRFPLATIADYATVVFMRQYRIKYVLSLDHHFDQISRIREFRFIKRIYDLRQI